MRTVLVLSAMLFGVFTLHLVTPGGIANVPYYLQAFSAGS